MNEHEEKEKEKGKEKGKEVKGQAKPGLARKGGRERERDKQASKCPEK